jgi:hypothetical protein
VLIDPDFIDSLVEMGTSSFWASEITTRIGKGLYLTDSFNFEYNLQGKWVRFPEFDTLNYICSYGGCDSPEQFMGRIGNYLESLPDSYVVSFVELNKEDMVPEGGWRWHKWGPYIGTQEPQCEYLYDEPVITKVYTYGILKKI